MGILQLLASRNFITVNKTLIQTLGIEEAIMLGELASEYDYWENNDKLEEGWFFSTVENVEENTTLTKYKQKKALDNLQKIGVLEVQRKGIPAKRYIKINEKKVFEILSNKKSKNLTSGSQEILLLEVKEFDRNNNTKNKNINNKNISKKEIYKERNEGKRENEISDDSNLPCTENSDTEKTVHGSPDNNTGNICKKSINNGNSNNKEIVTNQKVDNNKNTLLITEENPKERKKSSAKRKKEGETFSSIIHSYTNNEEMQELLAEFIKIRTKMKRPLTPSSLKLNLKELDKVALEDGGNGTDEEKIKIIERTVMKSYQSFYSLNSNVHSSPVMKKVHQGGGQSNKKSGKLFEEPSYDLSEYENWDPIEEHKHVNTLDEMLELKKAEKRQKYVDLEIKEND
jgi:hypothetical protein